MPRKTGLTRAARGFAPVTRAAWKSLIFLRKSGAGEGIRTLDPNLGKVLVCLSGDIRDYPALPRMLDIYDFSRNSTHGSIL